MSLKIINEIPDAFFNITSKEVLSVFPTPTLIHLKGERKEALFLSVLLHGNETTSFYVLQKFLHDKKLNNLPRDIIIFIGNVHAAAHEQRKLEGQPDYNRIWANHSSTEGEMATQVIEYAKKNSLFASIDIHNNTGHNPYYGCINKLEQDYVCLAYLFAPSIVYFTEPHEVQSMAFAKFTPAVTIECGIPGIKEGIDFVTSYVNRVYSLNSLDEISCESGDFKIYKTDARIILDPKASIDYDFNKQSPYHISLRPDIDTLNFKLVQAGEVIGFTRDKSLVKVLDDSMQDVTSEYLEFNSHEIRLSKPVTPSMLTTDGKVAREDCLGYFMKEKPIIQAKELI